MSENYIKDVETCVIESYFHAKLSINFLLEIAIFDICGSN